MTSSFDLDHKWQAVKKHYQYAYRLRFDKRPSDKTINYLFEQMNKLQQSLEFNEAEKLVRKNHLKVVWKGTS